MASKEGSEVYCLVKVFRSRMKGSGSVAGSREAVEKTFN